MSFADFFAARLIRLYPLYILASALTLLLVLVPATHGRYRPPDRSLRDVIFAVAFVPQIDPSRPGQPLFPLVGPGWSLAFELGANIVFAAIATRLTPRVLAAVVTAGAAVLIAAAWHFGSVDIGFSQANAGAGSGASVRLLRRGRGVPAVASGRAAVAAAAGLGGGRGGARDLRRRARALSGGERHARHPDRAARACPRQRAARARPLSWRGRSRSSAARRTASMSCRTRSTSGSRRWCHGRMSSITADLRSVGAVLLVATIVVSRAVARPLVRHSGPRTPDRARGAVCEGTTTACAVVLR